MADEGSGTAISFGTSMFSANIISVGEIGEDYAVIDTTHLGTTEARTYMLGAIATPKPITVTFEWDSAYAPPAGDESETITITWADGSSVSFTGLCSGWTMSGAAVDEKQTGTLTIQPSGIITITDI